MTLNGWLQFLIFFVVLLVCIRPLGIYMAKVFEGNSASCARLKTLFTGAAAYMPTKK